MLKNSTALCKITNSAQKSHKNQPFEVLEHWRRIIIYSTSVFWYSQNLNILWCDDQQIWCHFRICCFVYSKNSTRLMLGLSTFLVNMANILFFLLGVNLACTSMTATGSITICIHCGLCLKHGQARAALTFTSEFRPTPSTHSPTTLILFMWEMLVLHIELSVPKTWQDS